MSLLEKYQELKANSNPSIGDHFANIAATLEQMLMHSREMHLIMAKMASTLDSPMRISTWGSSSIVLLDTNDHKVPNSKEVVAVSAWVEGSPLVAPGISLVFNRTMISPTFQQVMSGPIPNPSTIALSAVPTAPIHIVFLTSALGGWQVW